ncbi:MAG: lipoprotein [Gammaproteobacteria bacterium]|nr:lipoprotein [Gammaproteobacteria bacterium]
MKKTTCLLILTFLLAGCGQTGALYLPGQQNNTHTTKV